MDRVDVIRMAERLMGEYGLLDCGWTFGFNRRKRALGLCNYTDQRIELSSYFVAMNDADAVRDTLLHEIAHALVGRKAGHGRAWAQVCRRLGAVPKPTCSESTMPKGAYTSICQRCGHAYDRCRKPKRGWVYYCGSCGEDGGKLRFVRKPALASNP